MSLFSSIINFARKKYLKTSQSDKTKILLEVTTNNLITNFQVQYPVDDHQPIIKEIHGSFWNQEIEMTNPENAYLKVFIIKPLGFIEKQVTLKMFLPEQSKSVQQVFQIEEDPTIAKWFKIDWQ
jgi:uncharacterized protein YxjI